MNNKEDDKEKRCNCDPYNDSQYTCDDCCDTPCEEDCGGNHCCFDPTLINNMTECLCTIKDQLDKCEALLWYLKNGQKEIKCEVSHIESGVFSPTFGLSEIKSEVSEIYDAVFHETYGLMEIKSEVSAILGMMEDNDGDGSYYRTTGPFLLTTNEPCIQVKAYNATATFQSVGVNVFNLDTLGGGGLYTSVAPCSLIDSTFAPGELTDHNYIIDAYLSSNSGILLYAATKSCTDTGATKTTEFKSAEWLSLASFCVPTPP